MLGARRRTARPPAADAPRKFPVVTCVPVDTSYDFPRTELAGMSSNIARLIEDIDRLDINRRNMMEELKVLRDVTLFYNEQHPELRAAESGPIAEDNEGRRRHKRENINPRDAEDAREKRQHKETMRNSRRGQIFTREIPEITVIISIIPVCT